MKQTEVSDYKPGDRVNTSREGHGTVKEIVGTRYVKVVPDGQPHSITVCIPAHGEIEQLT